ncbi:heterokaryon incompatibility protein-domain-containing protein [Xylariales sp. PMI_506]|nr:heterokaryon incompatibility protein-domain-containing protein [Xylariales sp. PMI_506]
MRLLNSCTWEIREFVSDYTIPPYAIVSHTWGDGQISFRDWQFCCSREVQQMQGFSKIEYCCAQAAQDGIEWVWIDTCCIDKTSSAELSEAINSMFSWYRNAVVCYAYLDDMPRRISFSAIEKSLPRCRWFTRGWTLQELIAPTDLLFFSKDWHRVGTKKSLGSLLSRITGIEEIFLNGEELESASVSKKMSWAANRETTRTEDMAYCLLGIFNINMPLLYGEGKKAFQRLQQEIMKIYPEDHTLFAWGKLVDRPGVAVTDPEVASGSKRLPAWDSRKVRKTLLGLLATSPKDFEFSHSLRPLPIASLYYRSESLTGGKPVLFPTPLGRSTRLELPIGEWDQSIYHRGQAKITQLVWCPRAILLCGDESNDIPSIVVHLLPWGDQCYGRTRELSIGPVMPFDTVLRKSSSCFYVEPEKPLQLRKDDFIIRRETYDSSKWESGHDLSIIGKTQSYPSERILRPAAHCRGLWSYTYLNRTQTDRKGFAIIIGRVSDGDSPAGLVTIAFLPIATGLDALWHDTGVRWWSCGLTLDGMTPHCDFLTTSKSGTWTLDQEFFPQVRVELERMQLDKEGHFVDAIDISVVDRDKYTGILSPLPNPPSTRFKRWRMQFHADGEESVSQRVSKRRRLL